MNQSTTQQANRRFRPVKLPGSGSQPVSINNLPPSSPAEPQVNESAVASNGVGIVTENGQILRQDPISHPRPSMFVERRLDKYVDYYRTTRENTPRHTPEQPPADRHDVRSEARQYSRQDIPAAPHPPTQSEVHFVARTDFEKDLAASQWETPVVQKAIPIRESALVQPPQTFHRVDAAHEPLGRAFLSFPVESNIDQTTRASQRESSPIQAPQAATQEQQILADPNTREIVAAVSSAIASVIKEQPQEELLPEAKNLFESNLKQHAMVLERQSADSQRHDTGISEAMISSIAQQRQQQAQAPPVEATETPVTLAGQLHAQIAAQQQALVGRQQPNVDPATQENCGASKDPDTSVAPMDQAKQKADNEQSVPPVKFKQSIGSSIPMDAAAWDVEDFRWPAITNQMIVSGGPAIEQLLAIATSRTSASPKRVVVSSAGRSQGATTIAITMARIAVAAGMRTLLVDADVASPSLSQRIGLAANMSWLNGVNKDLPVSELIVRSKANNLCMMPLSSTVTRVTWPRFIFDNLGELVSPGLKHFDLVLIDAGPASQLLDELSSPANLLDAVVLVDSNAKAKEIEVYQNRLTTFGVENLVLAENRKPAQTSQVA